MIGIGVVVGVVLGLVFSHGNFVIGALAGVAGGISGLLLQLAFVVIFGFAVARGERNQ